MSSYKGIVVPPSLTKTAGGQDMYVPLDPVAGGGDVFPGNVQIGGNLAVDGSSTFDGAVSCGSSIAATGSVSAASVTASGSVSAGSVTSSGAITGASLTLPNAGRVTNSGGSGSAPASRGFSGTRSWTQGVTVSANEIGLGGIINDGWDGTWGNNHMFFVVIQGTGANQNAFASAQIISYGGNNVSGSPGVITNNGFANGLSLNGFTGVPGAYTITLASSFVGTVQISVTVLV
jgi:hypothetical protein